MSKKAYHIVQWDTRYENSITRKVKDLTFYGKPNKLVGEGIGFTLQQPDNIALLGTWALIEALASTSVQEHRGWLIRNGTALTAARMSALIPSVEANHFARALEHFCRPEVNWLEFKENQSIVGESPTNLPPVGKLVGESPTNLPPVGKLVGESPTNLPQERERERVRDKREKGERGTHSPAAQALAIPSDEEVKTWAATADVHPEFAILKVRQACERGDFAKPGWKAGNWQKKLARFWGEDGSTWLKKNQKTAAASGRPDGWMEGDQDFWWTDSLQDLKASAHGASLGNDKKTAVRILQIITLREGKK